MFAEEDEDDENRMEDMRVVEMMGNGESSQDPCHTF